MNKVEMHFHTKETSPCGMVNALEGIEWFYNAGYQGVVVTDHFSAETLGNSEDYTWEEIIHKFLLGYQEAKIMGNICGVKVYLGMEIRFIQNQNDYLVYGITEEGLYRYPWMYELSIEAFSKISKKEGWCIIQAHPYRKGCQPANTMYLDGIEIHNANPRHDSNNSEAFKLANQHKLIMTVGSDFHREGDVSGCGILYDKLPDDEKELVRVLVGKKGTLYY